MFGACGFDNLDKEGYGKATVGLCSFLFHKGQICGACFELRCVQDLRNCISANSILITATNFCLPNYAFSTDAGGSCNPPNKHFVLPIEAFEKIALWKAGNMAFQFRR
ncbi:Expansin-A13 [Bienertia sinuspersici]